MGRSRKNLPIKKKDWGFLDVWSRLAKAGNAIAFLPCTALTEKLNALEALEDVTFNYESLGTLEAFVLRHDV